MTENQTPGPVPEDNQGDSRSPWQQQGPQQPGKANHGEDTFEL